MNILQNILKFGKKAPQQQNIEIILNNKEQNEIKEFSGLNRNNRVKKIMVAGESGNLEHFKLMQYAILYDTDINVKFAALKRIHFFKTHPELEPMLKKLKDNYSGNKMEPYFSMAMNRLGLISQEEFEQTINQAK